MNLRAQILGVRFELSGPEDTFAYTRAFLQAYDTDADLTPHRSIRIDVTRAQLGKLVGKTEPAHRSKHPYWNFVADVSSGQQPVRAQWPARGLQVEFPESLEWMNVTLDTGLSPAVAGESLFHLLRSFTIYCRPPGNFLHASAVALADKAVLFVGGVLAGKTTLFTESVCAKNARPLANDRVLLTPEPAPRVVSWPSYASYCEGTLLAYPALARAAQAFEEGEDNPVRTQRWREPLKPMFSVQHKRIYPMAWLGSALNTHYTRQRALGAVVFARLDPKLERASLKRLREGSTSDDVVARLEAESFDRVEPSFLPWHGLKLRGDAPDLRDTLRRLERVGVPLFQLEVNPQSLALLHELLDEVAQ